MINYYAYYSHGGFKDMLAGGQHDAAERTYHLPLVDSGIDKDPSKADVPRIKILGEGNDDSLPAAIVRLVSNGGYDVFYSRDMDGRSVLVVRDVNGVEKDDNGRRIPFVMELVGDKSDSETLAKAAAYFLNDVGSADRILGLLFHYDPKLNGLCFENKKLTDWLASLKGSSSTVNTVDKGEVDLNSGKMQSFISVKVKGGKDEFLNRLGLGANGMTVEEYDRILPEKDRQLCERRAADWKAHEDSVRKKKLVYAAIAGGVVAAGILVACLLAKCEHYNT